jgi:hypothetical protein
MRNDVNPRWAEGKIGFEQALELQKGLVIEGDVADVRERNPADLEAILDGAARIIGIELLAGNVLPARRPRRGPRRSMRPRCRDRTRKSRGHA